jgi:hypothetical protein
MKWMVTIFAVLLVLSCGGPKTAEQAYHDYLIAIKDANGRMLYNLLTPEAQRKVDAIAARQKPEPVAETGPQMLDDSLKDCRTNDEFNDMTVHITDDLIKRLTPMGEVKGDIAVYPGALGEKAVFEKRGNEWRLSDKNETDKSLVERIDAVRHNKRDKNAENLH